MYYFKSFVSVIIIFFGMLTTVYADRKLDKVVACFAYLGPVGDFGWSYQHDQSRQALEKKFGDRVQTRYLENIAVGADSQRAFERFARSSCDIIFGTSYGYIDAINKAAKKFSKVKFEHASGHRRDAPNLSTYTSKFYQGRYVSGQIAAEISKSGIAGYVASFPVPEVVRGLNAFILGAQSVNPDFKVKVIWIDSWFDPNKEADAARTLISQGADVVAQHTDSNAVTQIAEEKGVFSIGQASDMIEFGPNAQVTAIVNNWNPYVIGRVQSLFDGNWSQVDEWGGMAKGHIVMAPFTNIPDDVAERAQQTVDAITSGELEPFTGPINKQDGSEWLKAGQRARDDEILGINFFVEGIDDTSLD